MADLESTRGSYTAERVALEIRRAIRRHELLPGEHVRQQIWSDRVGASSASTREALKILVAEHLLSYEAHRGYFVERIDEDEMLQLYRLREFVEAEVLRSIRPPREEELESLRGFMDLVVERVSHGDTHGTLEAQRLVSFALFDLSEKALLVRECKRLWDMADAYRALSIEPQTSDIQVFFAAVLDCLERGVPDELAAVNTRRRHGIPPRVSGLT
jgi:DNA-binding GntR family transcriptional regulator